MQAEVGCKGLPQSAFSCVTISVFISWQSHVMHSSWISDLIREALSVPKRFASLLSYFQKAVLFTFCPNQNRDFLDYHCLLLLTAQISVHVHAARFGVVWNNFPGFAWLLLRCLWNIIRKNPQKSNEHWCARKFNSKNMRPLKCPDWKPMPATTKCNLKNQSYAQSCKTSSQMKRTWIF